MKPSTENDFFFNVGIDSMAFYAPKYYVDLEELAKVRGIDPNKYLKGLLTKEMRIPASGEDIISMAVKAGQHALMRGNIDPKEIDAIFVGTETVTYAVKSISNILSEILDISLNCITQDVYNACAGGTLAILNAVGLINDGIINKALIIGADICSYELESPGEPTQGAAAAALVISKNPRIALFGKRYGKISANINDFYRLPYEKYPVVFGKFSINSYIEFQLNAFDDFFKHGTDLLPDYFVFHSPFAKLPLKNMQNLLLNRWELLKKILLDKKVDISNFVNVQEHASDYLEEVINPAIEKIEGGEKERIKQELIYNLERRLLPTLNVPMSIGNMYSASTWAQMIYMLENVVKENNLIYFGSYGSGATCISGLLKVLPGFKKIVRKPPTVNDFIQTKERKSIKDYEDLRKEVNALEILHAHIEPHDSNENNFINMKVCEEGCIVSKLEGLDFCPSGRNRTIKRKYPMYAVTKSEPRRLSEEEVIYSDNIVRVTPETKKGDIVEFNLFRTGINESADCIKIGFLNWVPTYKPIPHPLE